MEKIKVNALLSRMTLNGVHTTFDGKRNVWDECGYPTYISPIDYYEMYLRNGFAQRIIEVYPDYTWMLTPEINEDANTSYTEFESAVIKLFEESAVISYLKRADTLSRIHKFAIIILGINDGRKLIQPAGKADKLAYLKVFKDSEVTITSYEENPNSLRYGLPKIYSVSYNDEFAGITTNFDVHFSRVIHVSEKSLESELSGVPALMSIWNDLLDIEKINGGASEMFWRGGYPGLSVNIDKDTMYSPEDVEGISNQVDSYIHGLRRVLTFQGIDVDKLDPVIASPIDHFNMKMQSIAAAKKIPLRIFIGSEEGKLASNQDSKNWNKVIADRQKNYAEPYILRPFINRLINIGILPTPANGFKIEWDDLNRVSEQEAADIGLTKAKTVSILVNTALFNRLADGESHSALFKLMFDEFLKLDPERTAIYEEMFKNLKFVGREETHVQKTEKQADI